MSSVVVSFVHAIRKHSLKSLVQNVAHFGSLGWILTIQIPFCSSGIALHHSTGMKFRIEWFQSYTLLNIVKYHSTHENCTVKLVLAVSGV